MKNYFVLTFSSDCDVETVSKTVKMLDEKLPDDKTIIAVPDTISIKNYDREEFKELLAFYIMYMEKLINE